MTLDIYAHVLDDTLTRVADLMAKGLDDLADKDPKKGPAEAVEVPREPNTTDAGSRSALLLYFAAVLSANEALTNSGASLSPAETLVGVTGFEPAASSSRTKRATKLRHTPWLPARTLVRGGEARD
jgi:hypothetical protein